MSDSTYNGWTNRATWNVNLWLANEYGWYCTVKEMAETAPNADDLADDIGNLVEGIADATICGRVNHGETLREAKAENAFGDCTIAELEDVEWQEIALSWFEDYGTTEEEPPILSIGETS